MSSRGNEVQVEFSLGGAEFIMVDEDSLTLFVLDGITTREEVGIYRIKIDLEDTEDSDVSKQYILELAITEKAREECG